MKGARVCQRCKLRDTLAEDMEFEVTGKKKKVRKYYHKNCFKEHLKDKEFKAKESKELDSLKNTIERIYNIKTIPHQAYPLLQNVRNGNPALRNQNVSKRYKEGYEYPVIEETFKFVEDDIKYWNKNKDFKNFSNAFLYGLTIVLNKIHLVDKKITERKISEANMKKLVSVDENPEDIYESSYKKRDNDGVDISDFLD